MGKRKRLFQGHRLINREGRPYARYNGQGLVQKWKLYDQVIGGTVKAGRIQLIALTMIRMPVGVMSDQGVDGDLRRNTKRKQRQHYTCQYGSYGAKSDQAV